MRSPWQRELMDCGKMAVARPSFAQSIAPGIVADAEKIGLHAARVERIHDERLIPAVDDERNIQRSESFSDPFFSGSISFEETAIIGSEL